MALTLAPHRVTALLQIAIDLSRRNRAEMDKRLSMRPASVTGMSGDAGNGIRSGTQRRRDTEHRLAHDVDLWVATASQAGSPFLVPLSFDWDGTAVLLATPSASPTGRNLAAGGKARLGLGETRDVTLIDGAVAALEMTDLPAEAADRFAARAGFDPRPLRTSYRWFRVTPIRIQAWREADELDGRWLMRDGRWLV
jgi:hypothetical protein